MLAADLSLRQRALVAPATKSRGVNGGLTRTRRVARARKTPVFIATAAAAAASSSSSSSPRRRPSSSSSSFALEVGLDGDDAPPRRSSSEYTALLLEAESTGDWVRAVELLTEARVLRVKLPASAHEAAARVAAEEGDWKQAASYLARAARVLEEGAGASTSSSAPVPAPPRPACSAVTAVFSRLAREVQAEACMDLLDLLRGEGQGGEGEREGKGGGSCSSWRQRPAETRSHALNCAARACARASTGGEKMMNDDGDAGGERGERQLLLSDEDRRVFFDASLSLLDDMREEGLMIEDGTFGACALAALAAGEPALSEELLEERDYL